MTPKIRIGDDRDRFVLSKGHCAPALYAVLANEGYFPVEDLLTLRHVGSYLQGHPDKKGTPGVDMSTGSLGQGVSAACGMAMAARLSQKDYRVYTILGDGEIEEGMVWEAAMFAGHYHLDNLTAVVDYNGLQIDGKLSEVCSPEPIPEKLQLSAGTSSSLTRMILNRSPMHLKRQRLAKASPALLYKNPSKVKAFHSWRIMFPGMEAHRTTSSMQPPSRN